MRFSYYCIFFHPSLCQVCNGPDHPGILRDMDLIWPEGFEEASSGGEREYELSQILERIQKKGQTEEQFKWFIELAKQGIK